MLDCLLTTHVETDDAGIDQGGVAKQGVDVALPLDGTGDRSRALLLVIFAAALRHWRTHEAASLTLLTCGVGGRSCGARCTGLAAEAACRPGARPPGEASRAAAGEASVGAEACG